MKKEEKAKKILKMLTEREIEQFEKAVDDDFGCQWDGSWVEGAFTELYKLIKKTNK